VKCICCWFDFHAMNLSPPLSLPLSQQKPFTFSSLIPVKRTQPVIVMPPKNGKPLTKRQLSFANKIYKTNLDLGSTNFDNVWITQKLSSHIRLTHCSWIFGV
jgi:hypothetical protein